MVVILIILNIVFLIIVAGAWIKIAFTDKQVNQLKNDNQRLNRDLYPIDGQLEYIRNRIFAQEHGLKLDAYYIVQGEVVKAKDTYSLDYIARNEHKEIKPEKW
ncbi:hypothetical protein [Weissella bombi]|uniref:Uncharacterized protein n=2 Tax=Weissella bombi TaxID=1505725 RepID=A0A1C4C0U0_9LACO|nr:hypothetical protein [Weissella bombi]SCC12642.1 hypothetical protein GA0061074_1198 [Weissella bombi]